MNDGFAGKTILITGGTAGIGLATAHECAKHGARLLLVARNEQRLRWAAEQLRTQWHAEVDYIAQDVSHSEEFHRALRTYCEKAPVHHAILNAGIGHYGPFVSAHWKDISSVLHTNIDGVLAGISGVLPSMSALGSGSIVIVASILGKRALPFSATYSASKAAIISFASALRLEVRSFGIHVGVLIPARVKSEFADRMLKSAQRRTRKVPESSAEFVAKALVKMIATRKREKVLSFSGAVYSSVGHHFPRTTDLIFSSIVPKPNSQ